MPERIHADSKELARRRAHAASRRAEQEQAQQVSHASTDGDTSDAQEAIATIDDALQEATIHREEVKVASRHIDELLALELGGLVIVA